LCRFCGCDPLIGAFIREGAGFPEGARDLPGDPCALLEAEQTGLF
jgi:hypothetical protein